MAARIPLHDHIHELRVQLDAPAHTVGLLTGDQGRAAAEERIEDDAVGHSGIADWIAHQADGLHGRMILVGLRPVILPYGRLLPVGIPLVLPLLLPAVPCQPFPVYNSFVHIRHSTHPNNIFSAHLFHSAR